MTNNIRDYYVHFGLFVVGFITGTFLKDFLFKNSSNNTKLNLEKETNKKEEEVLIIPKSNEDIKMVLCVRTDLKMTTGKIASQCSHATLGVYRKVQKKKNVDHLSYMERWLSLGQAKITLRIDSEKSLLDFEEKAKELNLPCFVVADAGKTQIDSGSLTVLAIGPAPKKEIDKITGKLSLL